MLVTLTLATGVFGLATSLQGSADGPWNRVWNATNGFHVDASYYRQGRLAGADRNLPQVRRTFAALAGTSEVRAVGGPWTQLDGRLDIGPHGGYEDLTAEVRSPVRSPVDQPLLTAGSWLSGSGDGIVLEQGLANALHTRPGDQVRIDGHRFTVRGVALTVSQGRFPFSLPALAWVNPATGVLMERIGLHEDGLDMQVRLANADDAAAFVAAHEGVETDNAHESVLLQTWSQQRAASHSDLDTLAATLLAAGILVGLLAIATAGVIVAGRMAAQTRQIGALKAVGVTPRQVVAALLVEHLALAGLAVVIGLGVGRLIAPSVAGSTLTILGDPQIPAISGREVGAVAGVAVAVVLLSTVRPAIRGLRHTTLRSLSTRARPPRRPARLANVARDFGMPLSGVLGLRSAWRRPSSLVTNAAGLTLALALLVVASGLRALPVRAPTSSQGPGTALSGTAVGPLYHQIQLAVLVTTAVLVLLGVINAAIVASFAARDGARSHAMLRAIGALPRQSVASLVVSQLGACILAIVAGIPLGLGAWRFTDNGDLPSISVPAIDLLFVAVAIVIIFIAAVSIPARRLAQRPVAAVLAYE